MSTVDAVGSSLLAVGTFGLATSLNYAQSGLVDWVVAAEFIAGGVAGGLLGVVIGARIGRREDLLNRIFAVMIFAAAGSGVLSERQLMAGERRNLTVFFRPLPASIRCVHSGPHELGLRVHAPPSQDRHRLGFATGAPAGLIHDAWNIRLVPRYWLGVFLVLAQLATGLQAVLAAHGVRDAIVARVWTAGLAASAAVATAILAGMCDARM